MKRILLAGATGYLGSYILRELIEQKFPVRVLVRNRSKLKSHGLQAADIVEGEVTKPETILNCCEAVDTVISTVGITRQKDGLTYLDVDYQANMNLLMEARRSEVKKFIYISVLHGDQLRKLKICEAKERFVDALKRSGMEYCIIRPTGFFSDMTAYLNMAKKGKIFLFGKGLVKMNPIHGADLAQVCVSAINKPIKEIEAGGPRQLTQNDMAISAFGAWNKKVSIVHLPDWSRRLIVFILRRLTSSRTYGPVEFVLAVMARDMVAPGYGQHTLNEYFNEIANLKNAAG